MDSDPKPSVRNKYIAMNVLYFIILVALNE